MTGLDDDNRIAAWAPTRGKRFHRSTGVQWEIATQAFPTDRQGTPVRFRVGNQQDDVSHGGVVPELQHHPPFGRLQVSEPRLGLERIVSPVSIEYGVPSAGVRSTQERHLGPPSDRLREADADTIEEPHLCDVPNRVSVREETQARYQSDGQGHPT